MSKSFRIINGPTKDALFYSMKHSYDEDIIVRTIFVVTHDQSVTMGNPGQNSMRTEIPDMQIIGISHNDDSGECYAVAGYCHNGDFMKKLGEGYSGYFEAIYRTNNKSGQIFFDKE